VFERLVLGFSQALDLRCMMQFAEQFPDFGIVSALTTQLSWSHVVEVLALKTPEARLFYPIIAAIPVPTIAAADTESDLPIQRYRCSRPTAATPQ
jgi:hypothetical protein